MILNPRVLFRPMYISCIIFLSACSDSEVPQGKKKAPAAAKSEMSSGPAPMTAPESPLPEQGAPMQEPKQEPKQEQHKAPAVLENGVIYQEEIYKNWPYTAAPPATTESSVMAMAGEKVEEAKIMAEEQSAAVKQKMEATAATVTSTAAASTTKAGQVVKEMPVPGADASNATASTTSVDGGQIYNTYCAICHKAGMNAAPKYGSKPLWAKRIAQGRETVYSHAINGLRGMPPRGGFANLSDDEIKAGTDYMVRAAGGWGDK